MCIRHRIMIGRGIGCIFQLCLTHDDVIKWKLFHFTGLCAGNSPVTGQFPAQRPVTRGFDVFCDLRLNKRLSKQSWGWWCEITTRSLWRHCNAQCELGPFRTFYHISPSSVYGTLLKENLARNRGTSRIDICIPCCRCIIIASSDGR